MFTLDRKQRVLSDAKGRRFELESRRWRPGEPVAGESVGVIAAATWLQRDSGQPLREPVAVIGPRHAGSEAYDVAETLGEGLARLGFTVVCGGREGIMEAVCRGAAVQGGLSLGLLPDADADAANPYVGLVIATGIGEARNAVVARSGFCLIAIGNSYGTLSEVAFGLQFGKPVLGLLGSPQIEGVVQCAGPGEALRGVARCALALPVGSRPVVDPGCSGAM